MYNSVRCVLIVLAGAVHWTGTYAVEQALTESSFDSAGNCVIEPNMTVELSARVDGVISSIDVQRGDTINAGEIVAELDAGVESAAMQYAQARASMESEIKSHKASAEYGRQTYQRVSRLSSQNAVAVDELDRVRSESEIAHFRWQASREQKRLSELEYLRSVEVLKQHSIRSPISGIIAERYLNPGESVEDQPLVKIAQIHPLRVEVVMPAERYGHIHRGDRAVVQLDDSQGSTHRVQVVIVDPIIDPASGTFRVTLELPNPDYALTSGLRCSVSFTDESNDPRDANKPELAETPDETTLPAVQPTGEPLSAN